MGSSILLLVLWTPLATAETTIPESETPWESLVMCLRSLDMVGGEACGATAEPAEFFTLSQMLIASGTEGQFEELLKDDSAVVRCMGLTGLAQMGGRKHAGTIRSYLNDCGLIWYMPGRCLMTQTTVGAFATDLLFTNGRALGYSDPLVPLVPEEERVGLCLEILAADSAVLSQPQASWQLQQDVKAGKVHLRLAALREAATSLQEFEIIKAVGRLPRSKAQRDFLRGCLASNSVDEQGKLAAASALTRHTDDATVQALQRKRDVLNRLGERPWGDEFVATSEAMKAHEKDIRVFRPFAKRRKEDLVAAVTSTHPLALSTLRKQTPAMYGPDNRDFRQAWATSLVAISQRVGDFMQPWNTYANSAFELDLWIELGRTFRQEKTANQANFMCDENWLTANECHEIERNVTQALNASSPAK